MALTTTTTVTKEVKLDARLKRRLLTEFRTYAELKQQADALKAAMDKHKDSIAKLREETGEMSISLEGFKTSRVQPTRSVLNKKKLVELGCAVAWIEEATETKPTKAYEKVTVPGGRDEEEE